MEFKSIFASVLPYELQWTYKKNAHFADYEVGKNVLKTLQ